MLRALACLTLVFSALAAGSAQTPAPAPAPAATAEWQRFVRTFDAAMDSDHVAGGAVVLVRDGRIVAHHERGIADRANAQPVDQNTLFHYGSITKTLTAISIMQLRDRGKLSLDDRIVRWVPELRQVHDPYGMIDSITIRMLLSHSAGFQGSTWPYTNGERWEPFEPTTWNQLVAMMPYQTLHFRPGSRFGYSNPGYIYLARVIEAISGDPWEAYVQKNIFAPLGLARSYFGATPYYLERDRAASYAIVRREGKGDTTYAFGREFDPGITIPNGGWNAPLADLATYVAFLTGAPSDSVARRRYDVVLKRSSLEEMWRPIVPAKQDSTGAATQSIGLSFFVIDRAGTRIIGHTGSQAGFVSFLYIDPVRRTGVVAVFNTNFSPSAPRNGFSRASDAALEMLGRR